MTEFEKFKAIVERLRAEDGCPWDRVQTHKTIRRDLLEEAAELCAFFRENRDETATRVADTVNDTYLKASGDESGIASYGAVCDQLVNWYITQYATPEDLGEPKFDPFDETQVDLSGIVNYTPPETEATEATEATEETQG